MGAGGVIAATLLGGGVIYLVLRAKKQAEAAADPCAQLAAYGVPKGACDAARGALNLLGAINPFHDDSPERDAKNKTLNGPVKVPLDPALANAVFYFPGGGHSQKALQGTVVEFENGCRPFEGAKGWEKCVPGTQNMGRGTEVSHYTSPHKPGDVWVTGSWSQLGAGGQADPLTLGPFTTKSDPKFPLPLGADDEGWYYKGRPFTCKQGNGPDFLVRDHRTGHDDDIPPCGAGAWGNRPPPHVHHDNNPDGFTGYHVPTGGGAVPTGGANPPPGFTWSVDHWERLRAGQTPVPRP